jgi:hypothetical protein
MGYDESEEWKMYEGMDCGHKSYVRQRTLETGMQRAFIFQTTDSYSGCNKILQDFLIYNVIERSTVSKDCIHTKYDESGAPNPEWAQDPCCNWNARLQQCCAPKQRTWKVNTVTDISEENIAEFAAVTGNPVSKVMSLSMDYKEAEKDASLSCFPPFYQFWNSTKDLHEKYWKCEEAVRGKWNDQFQKEIGIECQANSDCYTDECETQTSNMGGAGAGMVQEAHQMARSIVTPQ